MYVCLCHNVTDKQIKQAVADGVATFVELQFETGVATGCGKCESCARDTFMSACQSSQACAPIQWFPAAA